MTLGAELIEVVGDKDFATKFARIEEGTLLPPGTCTQIETITGIGTTQTADGLFAAIDRLARIAIGDIKIEFTPGQLTEIRHRAFKRGSTVKQELQRIVDRIKDELFHHS